MGSLAPTDKQNKATTTGNDPTCSEIGAAGLLGDIVDAAADTLAEAAKSAIPIAELHGPGGDEEQASEYWDAVSMAPLNAVSAVSISRRAAQLLTCS